MGSRAPRHRAQRGSSGLSNALQAVGVAGGALAAVAVLTVVAGGSSRIQGPTVGDPTSVTTSPAASAHVVRIGWEHPHPAHRAGAGPLAAAGARHHRAAALRTRRRSGDRPADPVHPHVHVAAGTHVGSHAGPHGDRDTAPDPHPDPQPRPRCTRRGR